MRRLGWFIAWGASALLILALSHVLAPFVDRLAAALKADSWLPVVSPAMGICASVLGALFAFTYVSISQNCHEEGMVRSYRWAERELIRLGRMGHAEILEYHRSYNWYSYAAIGFSTIFIVVPLLLDDKLKLKDIDDSTRLFALLFGLALVAISTIVLGVVDFVHTNTLTPLVTPDSRFHIIHWVLVLGGAALAMQICAVGVFLSLISAWLAVLSSLFALPLMVLLTRLRGIPVEELVREHGLNEEEARTVVEARAPSR